MTGLGLEGKWGVVNVEALSLHRSGVFSGASVLDAAQELRSKLGRTAAIAFTFTTPDYASHLEEFSEILRVDGHVRDVIGSTASGFFSGGEEMESGSGFSILAVAAEGADFPILAFDSAPPDAPPVPADVWVAFANPFSFSIDEWLSSWNTSCMARVVGGLSSGGASADECPVHVNGKIVACACFGARRPLDIVPVVCQGCRPIGEPLTVTRAQDNVVFALGARPAYEALESAFETLSDNEKQTAKGNLFAGLAGTEYVDDFRSGDFLVRNILGADPNSGAVVIGGIPRVGQTLQYHYRNAEVAEAELVSGLRGAEKKFGKPLATLAFACNGRGRALFPSPNHDAAAVQAAFGGHPVSGMFCSGEVAPIGGKNCVHSYSLALALFAESRK